MLRHTSAALLTSAPSLAARLILHSRRDDNDNDNTDETHCSKCGTYILDGHGGSISLTTRHSLPNNNNNSPSRATALRRVCHICGHRQIIPLSRGNAVLFPKRRPRRPSQVLAPDQPISAGGSVPHPSSQSLSDTTTSTINRAKGSKSRRNNKSALQVMLARNREKEKIDRDAKSQQSSSNGLAAFLGGL